MVQSVAATYLVDTSVLARAGKPPVAGRLGPLVSSGRLALCSVVELEYLFTARNEPEHDRFSADLRSSYELIALEQPTFDRAIEVQGLLARHAQHRGVPAKDLMIAAAAERAQLTLLHYDADFEAIAAVTHQPVEWVVPRGSID